jgi:hypothetical protein
MTDIISEINTLSHMLPMHRYSDIEQWNIILQSGSNCESLIDWYIENRISIYDGNYKNDMLFGKLKQILNLDRINPGTRCLFCYQDDNICGPVIIQGQYCIIYTNIWNNNINGALAYIRSGYVDVSYYNMGVKMSVPQTEIDKLRHIDIIGNKRIYTH